MYLLMVFNGRLRFLSYFRLNGWTVASHLLSILGTLRFFHDVTILAHQRHIFAMLSRKSGSV